MTDRLSQLLHDEAAHLTPPPPDTATILLEGRRLRRRQRVTTGVAAAAVAAVVVTTAGFVALQSPDTGARDVGPAGAGESSPAVYAVGSDVVVGDTVATVPDTVHSLHYTAAGVLVRSNPNDGASDGSGPESLTLVRWDGSTADLGTVPEGVGPATDPARDVYVLAEAEGDGFVGVVRDVETGEVVQQVPLPDGRPSYWAVPPLALDGDDLYVGFRNEAAVVDLASGDSSVAKGLTGGIPQAAGGRALRQSNSLLTVVEARTGQTLLDVDLQEGTATSASLSPDGRWLLVMQESMEGGSESRVLEVATGEEAGVELTNLSGWTATGEPFSLDDDGVTTCKAATGECVTEALSTEWPPDAFPRLGGRTYES